MRGLLKVYTITWKKKTTGETGTIYHKARKRSDARHFAATLTERDSNYVYTLNEGVKPLPVDSDTVN